LEKLFFFLSHRDDYVHITEPVDSNYLKGLFDNGFEIGSPWSDGDLLPDATKLIEWGSLNDLDESSLALNSEKFNKASYLNSKLNQREWKVDLQLSEINSKYISSEEQLIDYLNDIQHSVVLKAEYGLAGRNHIIIENQSQGWKLQQVNKKLFRYPIFAEEWVGKSRFLDFSTLWDFRNDGPVYLGSTEMIIDEDGSFRGISMSAWKEKQLINVLPSCLDTMKSVYNAIEFKPTGPAAMDGFFYKSGSIVKTQVFSEINFRYSMGRILYEIRKRRNLHTFESGILFLSLSKIKSFNEDKWLEFIRKETSGNFFFATPLRDWKGKLFQTVGIYYETNENSLPADSLIPWILEEWQVKLLD
jgi:hypothetical protein